MSLVEAKSCVVCNAIGNWRRCSYCKLAYYCSRKHQKQDWKRHKSSCQKTTDEPPIVNGDNFENAPSTSRDAIAHEKSFENGISNTKVLKSQNSNAVVSSGCANSLRAVSNSFDENSNTGAESLSVEAKGLSLNQEKSATEKALRSAKSAMPISGENVVHPRKSNVCDFPEISLRSNSPPLFHKFREDVLDEMCRNVIKDMDLYGVCVVDNFLGEELGKAVLAEVIDMHTKGVFKDGQLVSSTGRQDDIKSIRGDQIVWIDGREKSCHNIGLLISQVDSLIIRASKMVDNGSIGHYNINGRTKAMVACYPGSGSHYVKHVDNPNNDGRCITAIYYLNLDWEVKTKGGLLRIFPEGFDDKVADIEPVFDRLLFFWSDRRNPHEVQPAYHTRFAITLWYFDAIEREEAHRRFKKEDNGLDKQLPVKEK